MDTPESDRLSRLETEVATMREEMAVLRGALRYREGAAAPKSAPRRDASVPRPHAANPPREAGTAKPIVQRPTISVEQVIGRYGTLAIGTIMVLLAFGSFLTWAVTHGFLGPEARVVLGALGALALAGAGAWLRARGTREFGNILLAIALAATHVVCWGAGPHLHIVPPLVALGVALAASALLAELALRHEEETLCAIGFGGAALAPFVSSTGDHPLALAAYGLAVVVLAAAALRGRRWLVARRVVVGAFIGFEIACLAGIWNASGVVDESLVDQMVPLFFPLAVMVAVIAGAHARHRRYFIRYAAVAAIGAAGIRAVNVGPAHWAVALTVVTALVTALALELTRPTPSEREEARAERRGAAPGDEAIESIVDGALIPMTFLGSAMLATPGFGSFESVALAAAWSVAALVATYATRAEDETEWYAVTAALSALCIPLALFAHTATPRLVALVGTAVVLAVIHRRLPRRAFAMCASGALAPTAALAIIDLHDRVSFAYMPFVTAASLEAAVVTAGWAVLLLLDGVIAIPVPRPTDARWRAIAQFGCVATAFLWVREELAGGWNATTATVLLVAYYGATGGIAIRLGKRLDEQAVRLLGLGLTLFAAWKTLVEAFDVPNVAVRIGLFILVSGFLIGVAYWYRRGAEDPGDQPMVAEPT